MWTSIITALLPIALKILNSYFEKNETDTQARFAYLKFLEAMQKGQSTPAKAKNSYDAQIQRLETIEKKKPDEI